ncbi:hypothetical protein BGZ61DRAFT_586408 [Ilyonectria robusta]|uniref:uncharacterized protein n=1 Tax=Ilyonectria robusta TaxID=1079257 RepID=UPI001E8CADF3|nr:uncharacterized protein BGZ61DRAFT_586408 [Ilyonectria robusta]KAH8729977.1 hypothetical protein BGZ61DRAFT_586408 [Ilyonectria robusta]
MSTPDLPSPRAPHGAAAPPLPPGWLANWSPEHNAWYYVLPATGATQWEFPTAPSDQPQYPPPGDHQMPPTDQLSYNPALEGADQPAQDGDRGLGKTALSLGGGFLAGSSLRHKFENHHQHHDQQHGLGKMTQSMAMAGAGAIGAKIFGLFGNKQQQQQQPPPQQTQVHVYPVYVPGPQGAPPQSYHGQPPPVDPNYAHIPAGAASGVALGMGVSASPHHPGGTPVPFQGPGVMGAFAPQNGPPLHIYGAMFADKDVTQIVRHLVTPQQTLTIKGESLVEQFGDPWPEAGRKMFNVLYSYGDRPMEFIAADTTTGSIEIKHEAISKKRMEFCQPPTSRIIACVWGYENALTRARLEQLDKDGELDGSGESLGAGGFWGWEPKVLACYYRTETGDVATACCRDGGTVRLPWNPLAKWS